MQAMTSTAGRLREAVGCERPLERLRDEVRRLVEQGHERDSLLEELERLRVTLQHEARDAEEDVVLEVMDFLTGWCSPHMRI